MRVRSYSSLEALAQDIRKVKLIVKTLTQAYQEQSNILAFVSFTGTQKHSQTVLATDTLKDSTQYLEKLNLIKKNLNNIRLALYTEFASDRDYDKTYQILQKLKQTIIANEEFVVTKLKDTFENKAPKTLLNVSTPLFKEITAKIDNKQSFIQTHLHPTEDGFYYSRFLELSQVCDTNKFKYPRLHIGISRLMGSKSHLKCGVKTDRFDPSAMRIVSKTDLRTYLGQQLNKLNVLKEDL